MKNIQEIIKKLKNKKILVVEDDQFLSKLIFDTFAIALGATNIFLATDGQDGFNKYQQLSPDIVITDMRMPNMSGEQMARLIKEDNANTPIIMLSAYTNEIQNNYISDKILSKPINFNILFENMDSLV